MTMSLHSFFGRPARLLAFASAVTLAAQPALACSSVQLSAADGSSVVARTMDFGLDLQDHVALYPRGQVIQSTAPGGAPGLRFTSRYASFGLFPLGVKSTPADAMNEKGLTIAVQWLNASGFARTVPADQTAKALFIEDLVPWFMGQFATVEEVKAGLSDVAIWAAPIAQLGNSMPTLHFILFDASGKGIVVEVVDEKLRVYDNPVGVATNDPTFDWQLTNLQNYVSLSPQNTYSRQFGALDVINKGHGSGQVGLPGDPLPASRFARLVVNRAYASVPAGAPEAIAAISHIIGGVVVPDGVSRLGPPPSTASDKTLYTTLRDQKNGIYYIRPMMSANFYRIDLKRLWDRSSIPSISIVDLAKAGREDVTDLLLKP